ncbi:MAG: beta-phosphoglucomutase [Phycisphaerae bacterium]
MSWIVDEQNLPGDDTDHRNVLLSVGNGRFCTRGTPFEAGRDQWRGVYLAGLWTRGPLGRPYLMQGVYWPHARLCLAGSEMPCIQSRRRLDLYRGVLTREAVFESGGTRVCVSAERFASLASPNIACQRLRVTLERSAGPVNLDMGLDADVRSHRAKYYKNEHLRNIEGDFIRLTRPERLEAGENLVIAVISSPQANLRSAVHATCHQSAGEAVSVSPVVEDARTVLRFHLAPECVGKELTFEKVCAVTGDLEDVESAVRDGERLLEESRARTFEELLEEHTRAMGEFWEVADVEIAGDARSQTAVRFACWSTRIAAGENEGAASVGAKNLTGDFYLGGVFWDMDMFQLPLLTAVAPQAARNHVLYRARRLPAARTLALQDGLKGASYPWDSFASGDVDCPKLTTDDVGYLERHVNLAVAMGILRYWRLTGDDKLMLSDGLEVVLEACRFFVSRAEGPDENGRYHIRDVCGPDEFSLHVDDNAYTNILTRRVIREAIAAVEYFLPRSGPVLDGIRSRCGAGNAALERWRELAENLHIPRLKSGTVAQFEGFDDVPEPDTVLNQGRWGRIDKTSKQADTILIHQALPDELSADELDRCWREYAPLCMHYSSLSYGTHALVAARLGLRRDAEKFLRLTEDLDLYATDGGAKDGIHGAGEGGYWLCVVQGFGGLEVLPSAVRIAPALPPWWDSLKYRFLYRCQPVEVSVSHESCRVTNHGQQPLPLALGDEQVELAAGETRTFTPGHRWRRQGLEGVIFDLDGVLVSTDRLHYQAWKELADELRLEFDEQVNHRLRGVSRDESLRLIYRHNGLEPPDDETLAEQCTRKNTRYRELVAAMTADDILPGAIELLTALRAEGIRTAVASASRNTPLVLERTGLAEYLDAVADGNCVRKGKPDGEGMIIAAQRMRVLPWACVGVEDAAGGIEAIHNAGMPAVGIGPQAAGADLQVSGVGELTVESLRKLYDTAQG